MFLGNVKYYCSNLSTHSLQPISDQPAHPTILEDEEGGAEKENKRSAQEHAMYEYILPFVLETGAKVM